MRQVSDQIFFDIRSPPAIGKSRRRAGARRGIVRWVIPPERLAEWKTRLLTALGENAQLLVDVIPRLALIVGPQPPAPEVGPMEARNRFRLTLDQFLQAIGGTEFPLVLFIDDPQWADADSVSLIQSLPTGPRNQALSGEIRLDRLLSVIMRRVMENAGAETACFILQLREDWRVEAAVRANAGEAAVLRGTPLSEAAGVSPEEGLDILHSSGRHLLPLIDDILDLSRVEAVLAGCGRRGGIPR